MSTREDQIPATGRARKSLGELADTLRQAGGEQGLTPEEEERQKKLERRTLGEIADSFVPPALIEKTGPGPVALQELASGFGTGLLHPIQVLTGEPEEVDSNHPIARTVGELGGILVSFAPFLKGAQITLRGVGFLRSAPLLRQIMEGSLAFGIYEAGAGDPDAHSIAERFVAGAALGAGGELLLAPLISRSRHLRIATEATDRPSLLDKFRSRSKIDPDALNIERQFHPTTSRNPEQIVATLAELSKDKQLELAVSHASTAWRPGGATVLRGIKNPDRVRRAFDTFKREATARGIVDDTEILFRKEGKTFEALILDQTQRSRFARRVAVERKLSVGRIGGKGYRPLSTADAVDLLRMDTTKQTGIKITIDDPERLGLNPSLHGQATGLREIFVNQFLPSFSQFETLAHEATHEMIKRRAGHLWAEFDQVFNFRNVELAPGFRGRRIVQQRSGELGGTGGAGNVILEGRDASSKELINEFVKATKEVLRREYVTPTSRKVIDDLVEQNRGYFLEPSELIARMVELMLLDPVKAKAIAPRAFRMTSRLVRETSPKLEFLLTKGERRNLNDWLAGIAREELQEVETFSLKITDKLKRQWEREGGFAGMEVFHNGVPKEWVGRTGKAVTVRNISTGALEEIPFSEIQRPLLGNIVQTNEAIERLAQEVLDEPPSWIGLLLEDEVAGGVRTAFIDPTDYLIIRNGRQGVVDWLKKSVGGITRDDALRAGFAVREEGGKPIFALEEGLLARVISSDKFGTLVRKQGHKGVLVEDAGVWHASVFDETTLEIGEDILFKGLRGTPDGAVDQFYFPLRFDRVIKNMLRQHGVDERDIDHLYEVARRRFQERLEQLLDPDVRQSLQQARGELARLMDEGAEGVFREDVKTLASRAGLRATRTTDGDWVLMNPENNIELGRFLSEDDVRNFIVRAGPDVGEDLTKAYIPSREIPIRQRISISARHPSGETLARFPEMGTEWETTFLDRQGREVIASGIFRPNLRTIEVDELSLVGVDLASPTAPKADLGVGIIRELRRALKKKFPTADRVKGIRTGTTGGEFREVDRAFSVELPSEAFVGMPHGGGPPPRFQEPLSMSPPAGKKGFVERVTDFQTIFAPFLSSMETFAKAVEEHGFGAAFSRIFEPTQKAILRIHDEIGGVARDALEGKTFRDQLEFVQTLVSRVKRDRYPVIMGWVENLSREEIAAGALGRPLNSVEKGAASTFEQLGVDQQLPRLIALTRMMERRLKGKKTFLKKWRDLQRRDLDPAFRARLEQLAEDASKPESIEDLMNLLSLSSEERIAVGVINRFKDLPRDQFSLFAVNRWLDAKPLQKGFKTGREQFSSLQKMNELELKTARELDKYFQAAFKEANLDAKSQLAGYWPTLRQWTEAGIAEPKWLDTQIPEATRQLFRRGVRLGEISLYDVDPVMVAYKHLRNIYMKKHFEPLLEDVHAALGEMRGAGNERSARVMSEYLNEIMGRPHKSFDRINEAIAAGLRVLGHKAPERFAERIVNAITATVYTATIPFRPALIIRNYWQMFQMTPGRIGFRDFFAGLEEALTKDGFEYAKRIGAIPTDVVPLMSSTEVLGLPQALRPLNLKMRRIFERGFEWYKKADDIGRAAAALGIRNRVNRHLGRYMKKEISWEEFKSLAKINTFKDSDIKRFSELFQAGNIEGAIDHLGWTLARETHFRYGHVNHPAGWGSVYGRLFGQFGTWPVQYKDYLIQGLTRGSTKDKAEFLATHLVTNGALLAGGAAVGLNLWSWVAFPSLNYTGGPFADMAVDLVRAVSGSPAEKNMALRNLSYQLPTFEDPRSVFVPGSYFLGDMWTLFDGVDEPKNLFEAAGFKFFEADDKTGFEWLLE